MERFFDRKTVFFTLLGFIMFAVLVYLQIKPLARQPAGFWDAEKQKDYANKLKAQGLSAEAVAAYQKYLQMSSAPPAIQANVYYIMGKISADSGDYEQALAYLYKAEMIFPDQGQQQEIGELIISCLENLGRGLDAQRALDLRTAVSSKQESGKVVARIGQEKITETEINRELQQLPPALQKLYQEPEQKSEFIKQYLVRELLARKAKRLGYDKDPELRRQLEDLKKQLLAAKVVNQELKEKADITPEQIQLYYQAHKERYQQPEKAKIALILVSQQEQAEEVIKELAAGKSFAELVKKYSEDELSRDKDGILEEWISADQGYLPGVAGGEQLIPEVFRKKVNEYSQPIAVTNGFCIVKVLEKKEGKQLPPAEIEDKVTSDLSREREQAVYKELLTDTLQSEDVEIYD